METITSADGTPIAYERTGSGPPLVRVHGTTGDHGSWDPVRPAFEERFTVHLIDRRGRGESGDGAEYELEREFEDVAAVVDALQEPVVLVGHSYGALCSLEAALRTDDLDGLVLYEPPLPVGDHDLYDAELHAEMEALLADGEDERVLELFLREVAGIPPAALDELRSTPDWSAGVETAHTIPREYAAVSGYEFDPARFEELTAPTLLVTGSESPPPLRAATDALHDALPNGRIVVLDGESHDATSTTPERYAEAVLARLDAPE